MPGQLPYNYRPKAVPPAESLAERILGFFLEKGLTKNQAAGIVGNLKQESKLNPAEPGGYLAQWGGSRLSGLESYAKSKGKATASGDAELQLEYIWSELVGDEKGTLAALKKTTTPEAAAAVFSNMFERPGEPDLANREKYAKEAAGVTPIETGNTPIGEGIEKAESAVSDPIEGLTKFLEGGIWEDAGQLVLKGVLLLAGAFLVVYGIMVAVRPRESALSLPKLPGGGASGGDIPMDIPVPA
jgi:hypothetical protein